MSNTTAFHDIPMPQMGESVTEATIVKWHKAVGDDVAADEMLLEISTAKVEAEIPAPMDGVVAEILFAEGDTVNVDTIIARLAPPGTVVERGAKAAARPDGNGSSALLETPAPVDEEQIEAEGPSIAATERERLKELRRRSTPLVRSMCRELGINVEDIPGTGTNGRVTKEDVLRFTGHTGGKTEGGRREYPVGLPSESCTLNGSPLRFGPGLPDFIEPMTAMRKQISKRMIESHRTSPHAYTVFEVDMTRVMRHREKIKDEFQAKTGVKITPLVYILKVLTEAIISFPILNAAVDGDKIVYHRSVNLGVAVALENGLIVPVIHNMQDKSIADIAKSLNDIATRARTKKLTTHDVEGGTFTITSPGQKGALMGLPIINQPQVGVLYIGSIKKRPTVIEAPDGTDVIAIRHMGILSLALDHRVIDGWVSDSFMSMIKERLETGDFRVME